MNKLVGVLTRFQQEEIAIMCHMEQMFHNFMVSEEHRDYFRFLWFQDGDMTKPIVTYQIAKQRKKVNTNLAKILRIFYETISMWTMV